MRLPQVSPACARMMRDVALERRDQDVLAPVELDDLLAFFGDRADAGRREKPAEAGAAAAHHLGQSALRRGLDLEPALVHGLADLGRRADVAGHDLPDLALHDQLHDAAVAVAGVVLVDGEAADVHRLELVDQRQRVALADEPADGDAHPVLHVRHRLGDADNLVLGHLDSFRLSPERRGEGAPAAHPRGRAGEKRASRSASTTTVGTAGIASHAGRQVVLVEPITST